MSLTTPKKKRKSKTLSALSAYAEKRRFSGKGKTNEPKGKAVPEKPGKKHIFVIHKHHASHLHWDLRLEMNGVLKSWAVPKEPPRVKGVRRLAMHVEDHPLQYARFHGTIPEGNYGAGKVEIWDKGRYWLKKKNSKEIEFVLEGKKMKGTYILVKTHYGSRPEKSWLWMKVG